MSGNTKVTGYTVNRKNDEGKFEKVSKLFPNADGSYSNKKDGFELRLSGKFPDLLVNGEQYGKTFLNTSKASGAEYYLTKHDDGDLFLFVDKPRAPGTNSGSGSGGFAAKKPFTNKK